MKKITDVRGCKVVNASGRIYDNAKGGPYKYGLPLEFNATNDAFVKRTS